MHEHELRLLLASDSSLVLADRATNLNVQDVSRLLASWRTQQLGPDWVFDRLEKEVKEYNKQHTDNAGKAIFQRFNASYRAHEAVSNTSEKAKNLVNSHSF
jgi:hypothetical protein